MIYIHVPFCKSFCTYCDFFREIPEEGAFDTYTRMVCQEIKSRCNEMDDSLHTLYFGGGTPSVLPLSNLTKILLALEECGHGGPYTEFTMEVNPEDVVEKGLPYLRFYFDHEGWWNTRAYVTKRVAEALADRN